MPLKYVAIKLSYLLLITMSILCGRLVWAQASSGLTAAVNLQTKMIPLHGLVLASVNITNVTNKQVVVDLGPDKERAFVFIVKGPDGTSKRIESKPSATPDRMAEIGTVTIQPGETYSQELLVNKWYSFETSGTYEIAIDMKAEVILGSAKSLEARCKQQITIGAPDPSQLIEEGEQLLQKIKNADTYDEAKDAATKLSAISDPSVVQYLSQAADSKPWVAPILIDGLSKFGTGEAIDGLIQLTASNDSDTHILAIGALKRLESTEKDPAIQEKIRTSLQRSAQP